METAVFNLPKGRAYVQLADSDGFILRTRDVTDGGNLWWKSSTVYALLSRHRLVCRKLVAAFRLLWNSPLPFPFFNGNGEMTPKDFLALVRFHGYPRSFYAALPYDDQDRIDRTFRLDGKRFRHAERLPALYDASVLPKKKSIRRLFFVLIFTACASPAPKSTAAPKEAIVIPFPDLEPGFDSLVFEAYQGD